tara:strand:+ start:3448 stop:3687 length:240 start_codon:yes stop_codon:yes gene_type:complete
MKYLIFLSILTIIVFPKTAENETIDLVQEEFIKFCKVYMVYVNKYPMHFAAGCCDFNHASNNRQKIEYLGDKFEKKECV